MYCIINDSLESLQLLIQAGCNQDLLLSVAVAFSKRKCFDFLLTQSVDLNELNSSHLTPIHYAILQNNRYFVLKLLESGADISIPDILNYFLTMFYFCFFHKNLLPLYNAIKSGSNEIVTALLDFESPTSYIDQAKTPLFKAIKKRYLKIAYKLIEAGAYPDSDNMNYNPIKISIEQNDEKTFLLLLLAGASTDKILEDKLSENFKKILNKFKCKPSNSANSIFDNELEKLIISLVQIQKEVKIFIDKSKDPAFLSKYLTPVINEINKKVVSVGNFVKKVQSFYKFVHNYRKELLSKQLSYLVEIEKNEIESHFLIDNNEWLEVAKQTEDIIKKRQNSSQQLPNNYFDSITAIKDQFLSEKDEVFLIQSKSSSSMISEKVALENRSLLLSLNSGILKKFYQICSDSYNLVLLLSQTINKILGNVEIILKKMRNLIINQQQLNFDFKNTDFEGKSQNVIDDLLIEKKSQFDLDLAFLKIEKENCNSMSSNLLRLIRYCIN